VREILAGDLGEFAVAGDHEFFAGLAIRGILVKGVTAFLRTGILNRNCQNGKAEMGSVRGWRRRSFIVSR